LKRGGIPSIRQELRQLKGLGRDALGSGEVVPKRGNAASGWGNDRIEFAEMGSEAAAQGLCAARFPSGQEGLPTAEDIRRNFHGESSEFKDFEGCEPDSGAQLIDVTGDEERDAHRRILGPGS
jgi:hypothetical protein